MTARVGSDVGPYRGPADATLHQQWRRERRAVIRLDHPDTGGDAGVLQQRLEAVDRRFRGLDGARPVAPPASAPPWQPVTRGVRRVVRRARRLGRATRATIPTGWPGHRHYIDL